MRISHIIFGVWSLLLIGCDKKSTDVAEETVPQLYFTPISATVTVGGNTNISLNLKDISPTIFALSLQMHCNQSIVSFSDSLGMEAGGFLGDDAIMFVQSDDSIIYFSITRTQGQSQVGGTGTLCTLELGGKTVGLDSVYIIQDKLHFYDSTGAEITVPDIELKITSIQCVSSQ